MDPYETYEHAGLTVELHYDTDAESPRYMHENAARIVTFGDGYPYNDYTVGDDQLDDPDELAVTCPHCDGAGTDPERYEVTRRYRYGRVTIAAGSESAMNAVAELITDDACDGDDEVTVGEADCARCHGDCEVTVTIAEYLRVTEDAALVILLDGRANNCGPELRPVKDGGDAAIYMTQAMLTKEWGTDREKAREYMLAELDEYNRYMQGEVSGYIVKGPDGERIPDALGGVDDSCWGFIGSESYVREQANEAAESIAARLAGERVEMAAMAARGIVTVPA